ncbi:MAG TPA: tail fiber domain-containing protein [Polyangiaceae bacterium]|nr:tail fiber domain-containing protein [Polyangiaceae bacterium]
MKRIASSLSATVLAAGVAASATGGCSGAAFSIGENQLDGSASSSSGSSSGAASSSGGASGSGGGSSSGGHSSSGAGSSSGGQSSSSGGTSSGGASSSSGGASSGGGSSSSGGSGSSSGSGGGLQWYWTCGDAVCAAPSPDAGACPASQHACACATGTYCVAMNVACIAPTSACPSGLTDDAGAPCPPVGSSCSAQGEMCGTRNPGVHCGAVEECSASNPAIVCPISSRRFKNEVQYVDEPGLRALHDETLALRLATYRYKPQVADPSQKHLGFIVEDTPAQSPAVEWSRDRVDLYGYVSMVVATMQVQEEEIAELRRELEIAKQGVCAAPVSGDSQR